MIDYDAFLSRAGERMQESAIRKMGSMGGRIADMISFGAGFPAPQVFPWEFFREAASELLRGSDGTVLQYGPTRGFKPLVDALSEILDARGITARPEDLLVTTGSQQGLDIVARVLLDPGDVVLVELPTYTGAITAFRNVLAVMVGVRQETDGVDLSHLDHVLRRARGEGRQARVLYVVPNFQNPTGLLMGLDKRKRLIEFAARHDLLIVEDDPYGDLFFGDRAGPADTRPIKADDKDGRVIYLSSFSKTLAPGFRVAWIAAPRALAAKFELAKQAADLCTGGLDQRIVYEAWRRGVLARIAPGLREHYQTKRDAMEAALRREVADLVSWPEPRGGFFIWMSFPPDIDADAMLERATAEKVIYVAGSAFFVEDAPGNLARFSFSHPTTDRIVQGVGRFKAALLAEIEAHRAVRGL